MHTALASSLTHYFSLCASSQDLSQTSPNDKQRGSRWGGEAYCTGTQRNADDRLLRGPGFTASKHEACLEAWRGTHGEGEMRMGDRQ